MKKINNPSQAHQQGIFAKIKLDNDYSIETLKVALRGKIIVSKLKHAYGIHVLGSHQFKYLDYMKYMGMCVLKRVKVRDREIKILIVYGIIEKNFQEVPNNS